ncbi:MAG: hypothetical protein ACE5I2_00270 [Anaerolineae bacterium]
MTRRTLSDAQRSIERFICEARECAKQELGFAAMSTVFPVILAVSEAVNPSLEKNKNLLGAFVSRMVDKTSWLVAPMTNLSNDDIATKLADVRDSLAHQLSLPDDVYLTNTSAEAKDLSKKHPNKYIISTVEFVDVVERTIRRIIQAHPAVVFDPRPRTRTPRAPADRVIFPGGTLGSISISQNLQPRRKGEQNTAVEGRDIAVGKVQRLIARFLARLLPDFQTGRQL